MKISVDCCQDIAKTPIISLEDYYEQQVKGLTGLKARWLDVCKEFSLPQKISLKHLVKLASYHHLLFELSEKVKMIDERISERRTLLIKLEELVMQWRLVNNSQKRTKLESSSMLVNEARSIIQYKEDRQFQLSQYNLSLSEVTSLTAAIKKLNLHRDTLLKQWAAAFRLIGLPAMDPTSEEPKLLLIATRKILQIEEIIQSLKGQPFEQLLAKNTGSDIAIWSWIGNAGDPATHTDFLKTLGDSSQHSPNIFLIEDSEIAVIAAKSGIGIAREILITQPAGPTKTPTILSPDSPSGMASKDRKPTLAKKEPDHAKSLSQSSANVKKETDAVINPKARAVLDILNRRGGSTKRGPTI